MTNNKRVEIYLRCGGLRGLVRTAWPEIFCGWLPLVSRQNFGSMRRGL